MQNFSGFEYLLIDIANNFGLDKKLFEERIQWTVNNMLNLEGLLSQADNPLMYIKSVRTLRDAQANKESGYMVSFDACSSGMQIMGAAIGCMKTCAMAGLIDPDKRADAYTAGTEAMSLLLNKVVNVSRKDVKQAMMTFFYGSKAQPKALFGEDTPELEAFYKMLQQEAPGAFDLMNTLVESWQKEATSHEWVMPDGFEVRCKVFSPVDYKIEVDELAHATFTHRIYENVNPGKGLSNAANVVHSIDGFFIREINRRCNYDREDVKAALSLLAHVPRKKAVCKDFVSVVLMDTVLAGDMDTLSPETQWKLKGILEEMMQYQPFEVVGIHD